MIKMIEAHVGMLAASDCVAQREEGWITIRITILFSGSAAILVSARI